MTEPAIDAEFIREALRRKYPADKHLHVPEAPQFSDRQGRKIDVLIIDLWKSRGLARHAMEIKCSMADFRKEIAEPEKADWWWRHSHDFTIVAPAKVAARIKANNELPATWGLMSVSDKGRINVLSGSTRNPAPEDLNWSACVGMMRAIVDVGPFVLQREFQRGQHAAMEQMEGVDDLSAVRAGKTAARRYDELMAKVNAFEEATGVRIDSWAPPPPADVFKAASGVTYGTQAAARRLAQVHGLLDQLQKDVTAAKTVLEQFPTPGTSEQLPFET